jgi:hypothetical protein
MLLQAELGAGIFMNENMGSIVNVSRCLFVQNQGHFGGGAMAIYDSDATVINCTMDSNWVSRLMVCAAAVAHADRYACALLLVDSSFTAGGGCNGEQIYCVVC